MANPHSSKAWKAEFLNDVEIENLAAPEWLIHGILPAGRFAVLYGPPEAGKTFLLLDWALSIATDRDWMDRRTAHGPVVYVPGEGMGGLRQRIAAWKRHHGHVGLAGVHFAMDCPHMMNPRILPFFIDAMRRLDPKLIILDTVARVMSGGDEDGAQDMGIFVDSIGEIIKATGASVCGAHHPLKANPRAERGSGALRGAADTMWRVESTREGDLTLRCEKQKDSEHSEDILLRRSVVTLADGMSSCVLESRMGTSEPAGPSANALRALAVLIQAPGRALRHDVWLRLSGIKPRTFERVIKGLLDAGLVTKGPSPGGFVLYRATAAALAATATSLPTYSHGTESPSTAATLPPSIEGEAAVDSSGTDRLGTAPLDDSPSPPSARDPRRPGRP